MQTTGFEQSSEQAAAFQKIWIDSVTKMMHASLPGAGEGCPPPEAARQIREAMFRALATSWDEFMRSPQFLQTMKEWIESAVNFQKLTGELLAKSQSRAEDQNADGENLKTAMATIQEVEQRINAALAKLSGDVMEIKAAVASGYARPADPAAARGTPRKRRAGTPRKSLRRR